MKKIIGILFTLCSTIAPASSFDPGNLNYFKYFQKFSSTPLNECIGCGDFPLQVRNKFQSVVVEDIENRFASLKSDTLVIASYASGNLLREFLIMSQLHEKGFENILLMAIDPAYFPSKNISPKVSAAARAALEYMNSLISEWGSVWPAPSVAQYLKFIKSEASEDGGDFSAHVILDVDSPVFSSTKEFDLLVNKGTAKSGVAYSLRNETLVVGNKSVNTGSLTIPGMPRISLPGFPDLDQAPAVEGPGLWPLPFSVQSLILEYARD